MESEPEGLEVLADSAYGSGATRTALNEKHHRLVIKPMPSHPAVPGGLRRDDFVVNHASRSVTCPAGHVARLSASGLAKFHPHCGTCPMKSRCTTAKARSFSVGPYDEELSRREPPGETKRSPRPIGRIVRWPSAQLPGSSRKGTADFAIEASRKTMLGCKSASLPSIFDVCSRLDSVSTTAGRSPRRSRSSGLTRRERHLWRHAPSSVTGFHPLRARSSVSHAPRTHETLRRSGINAKGLRPTGS